MSNAGEVSERASDRYLTTRHVLDRVDEFWIAGIDCDPFHDPSSLVRARSVIDVRTGGNAYTDELKGHRFFCNGPYSGRFPAETAKLCARLHYEGKDVLNLCPAAPGSDYWRRWVWPNASAIAWLGRLSFVAAVDMHDKSGNVTCPAGESRNGNRTEIALVYQGHRKSDVRRFDLVFSQIAHVTVL